MKKIFEIDRIKTGVRNLDAVLNGGLPRRSVTVIGGSPGAGKTILSQQIGFANASPNSKVIFFQTLSEPTAKTLGYLLPFRFYNPKLINESIFFVDLGDIMRSKGTAKAIELLKENIKRVKPAIVVIDSFKAFDDLAQTKEELRKFSYEVAINLMAWECTSLLLGEFSEKDLATSPLFSVVDGIIMMSQRESGGEQQRIDQVVKMRGTAHSRDEHPFLISEDGIELFAPKVTIKRDPTKDLAASSMKPLKTGISSFDALIPKGIPRGSTCLVSGVSGTGKSLFCLELLYKGAKDFNEKGLLVLFEETKERILDISKTMGWDLQGEVNKGMIEIIFVPQTDILVEQHLVLIHDVISRFEPQRVVIDSTSIFLHKLKDPRAVREKIYQLATIIQRGQAVGFFISDVASGAMKLSRFGVEETVVDGIILLTSEREGLKRNRFFEIYKLRNSSYKDGAHPMKITNEGIAIKED